MEVGKGQARYQNVKISRRILLRRRRSGPSETFMQLIERGGLAVDEMERAASDVCSRESAKGRLWRLAERKKKTKRGLWKRSFGGNELAALARNERAGEGQERRRWNGSGYGEGIGRDQRSRRRDVETSVETRRWMERRRGATDRISYSEPSSATAPHHHVLSITLLPAWRIIESFRSQGGPTEPSTVQCTKCTDSLGSVSLAGEHLQRGGGEDEIKVQGRTMGLTAR